MEEDADMNDSSTSAKRSKLENVQISTEENIVDFDRYSCSSNDITMENQNEKYKLVDEPNKEISKNELVVNEDNVTNKTDNKNNQDTKSSLDIKQENIKDDSTVKADIIALKNDVSMENETCSVSVTNSVGNVNEEPNPAASTSNFEEQEVGSSETDPVRKIRNRNRHYRPRRISSSDSSINNSDLNLFPQNEETNNSNSEHEAEGSQYSFNEDESIGDISSNTSDSDSDTSFYDSNSLESNDSDDELLSELHSIQESLTKDKPKHKTNLLYEIMYREHGLSGPGLAYKRRRDPMTFQSTICNSRLTIEKLRVTHNLRKHRGCVNSLNFDRSGKLLCTGSDDLKIVLWDWANNKIVNSISSGHSLNVFQSKFVENGCGINIVSSSRDGQVRHQIIPPSGLTKNTSKVLFKHTGPVHKIAVCHPNEILTAGEDAYVVRYDLRQEPIERLVTVRGKNNQRVSLYSIAQNPLDQEFCVSGKDSFVRVYDKRNVKTPVYFMCPEKYISDRNSGSHYITCAVYNQSGTEILASYNDGDIYLFNNKCYLKGHFTHEYKGHLNLKTIKGVNFFGPNSEYIVSGSDCGNLFIWDKESEVIVNWQKGDRSGIVNCLEPHPSFPVLATSGLDNDVKIWSPVSETAPLNMEGLEKCVKQNVKRLAANKNDFLTNRTLLFFVERNRSRIRSRPYSTHTVSPGDENDDCPIVQEVASSSSSEYSSDADMSEDHMACATQ